MIYPESTLREIDHDEVRLLESKYDEYSKIIYKNKGLVRELNQLKDFNSKESKKLAINVLTHYIKNDMMPNSSEIHGLLTAIDALSNA